MGHKIKNINFIRFGNLKPIKQDGYKNDTYHSAPAKKGFYSFPENMMETFLLGGYNRIGTKYSKQKYLKHPDGSKVIIGLQVPEELGENIYLEDSEINKLIKRYSKQVCLYTNTHYSEKDNYIYITTFKRPKIFKHRKELWHHLTDATPPQHVLKRNKSWILTDYKTYIKALNKTLHINSKYNHQYMCDENNKLLPKMFTDYSKDVYEVFIERV